MFDVRIQRYTPKVNDKEMYMFVSHVYLYVKIQ